MLTVSRWRQQSMSLSRAPPEHGPLSTAPVSTAPRAWPPEHGPPEHGLLSGGLPEHRPLSTAPSMGGPPEHALSTSWLQPLKGARTQPSRGSALRAPGLRGCHRGWATCSCGRPALSGGGEPHPSLQLLLTFLHLWQVGPDSEKVLARVPTFPVAWSVDLAQGCQGWWFMFGTQPW